MPTTRMTFWTFESKRDQGRLAANKVYAIQGRPGEDDEYAISPDGIGFYFYETLTELEAEHG